MKQDPKLKNILQETGPEIPAKISAPFQPTSSAPPVSSVPVKFHAATTLADFLGLGDTKDFGASSSSDDSSDSSSESSDDSDD